MADDREAPRCATCRHWLRPTAGGDGYGMCRQIEQNEERLARPDGCTSEDGADAWLNTKAEFGCVMHEGAEKAVDGG